MVFRALKRLRGHPPLEASVPADTRVYAVGDIHGRADLLDRLHRAMLDDAYGPAPTRLVAVYIGDYVDRGLQSREVIDCLLGDPLPGFERVHLKGNHDAWMLAFLDDASIGPAWLGFGGQATLVSYGVSSEEDADVATRYQGISARLRAALPAAHREFLEGLALSHVEGDYAFVHAGVRPGVPLERQHEDDLLWIRDEFLRSRGDHGRIIVHGHTVTDEPDVHRNRIGIDTGAYASERLTCLVLEGTSYRFLHT